MPAVMPSKLMALSDADDPVKAIWTALGDAVDKFRVMKSEILVATYIEPRRTAGGIWKPETTVTESLWQGTCGLVLKKGPWAFRDDPEQDIYWRGEDVEVGDWVVFRFSDAWEFHLNGVSVRLVEDRNIRSVVPNPLLLESKPRG